MLRVNITGGIGSGKSTVANMFAQLGIEVADTDQIAHRLTMPNGIAIALIAQAFGARFIDATGAMDRALMRDHVFNNPSARVNLEGILHPLIRSQTEAFVQSAQSPYVMVQIPLLVESFMRGNKQGARSNPQDADLKSSARNLVVDCLESEQIARVRARNKMSLEQVQKIMAAQVDRATRLQYADDVIYNFDHQNDLPSQVNGLHRLYLQFPSPKKGNS